MYMKEMETWVIGNDEWTSNQDKKIRIMCEYRVNIKF